MLKQIPTTFQIQGKDTVPLRLVPYATGGAVSPVGLAQVLAMPDTILRAYAIETGTNNITPIPPKDWQVTANQRSATERPTNEACLVLPANTFVWLRDLELACDHYFMPDRREPGWTTGEREAFAISRSVYLDEELAKTLLEDVSAFFVPGLSPAPPPPPQKRQIQQEDRILDVLKALGFDPLKLPKEPPGRPGVKKQVRDRLANESIFRGGSIFDKAWDRLSYKKLIKRI